MSIDHGNKEIANAATIYLYTDGTVEYDFINPETLPLGKLERYQTGCRKRLRGLQAQIRNSSGLRERLRERSTASDETASGAVKAKVISPDTGRLTTKTTNGETDESLLKIEQCNPNTAEESKAAEVDPKREALLEELRKTQQQLESPDGGIDRIEALREIDRTLGQRVLELSKNEGGLGLTDQTEDKVNGSEQSARPAATEQRQPTVAVKRVAKAYKRPGKG